MSVTADLPCSSAKTDFLTRPVRRLLRLSPDEALFETRGFPNSNSSAQSALEAIGRIFVGGFNASLTASDVGSILQYVGSIPIPERGFAAEGAAMGAAVVDALPFSRPMLAAVIAALNSEYTYLAHVGAGWALARVPWRRKRILAQLDPIHHWLAIDGLGFHDTYFHHRRVFGGWRRESSDYAARAYDQGVGRALWFVSGGSVPTAARLISLLASTRQGDLWSGLGLAMAYAGPVENDDVIGTLESAGANAASFAQGVAFACEARVSAHYIPGHTDAVARAIWNENAGEVARFVRAIRDGLLETETDPPRYQTWRENVALAFSRIACGTQ